MSTGERVDAPIDQRRFRDRMGHFASGVTIVIGLDGDDPVGFTCPSFSSLSAEPRSSCSAS